MKDHLNTPFWRSKTFWLSVGSIAAFGTDLVNSFSPIVPHDWDARLKALGGLFAGLAALAARSGGVKAARQAAGQE